jgi:phage portal protein BeeE
VGLLERLAAGRTETRYSADTFLTDLLIPSFNNGIFGPRLNTTYVGQHIAEISNTLPAYMQALRMSPPAFAAQMVRALVLSQARFVYRNVRSSPTAGKIWGNRDLSTLERPWKNATTGELIARMEWSAGLTGNAFVLRRPDRLRVLRSDWTAILWGSKLEPDSLTPGWAIDAELIGYVYQNGGINAGQGRPESLLPDEVAHWSPLPDPESPGLGMSWITPAVREIQGDKAATEHKLQFFKNGATPNLVVKGIPATTKTQFDELVEMMESQHAGIANAYKTLYLTLGADATVVGSDFRQIDFKATQGAGETRIAFLSRVPAPLLGISEGLAGSSLNAGNFGMARRIFADSWIYPSLQDLAAALAPIIKLPADAELWFDTTDMPILREDAKDAAEIASIKASALRQLWDSGAETESAIATIAPEWAGKLKHTGVFSVQLQRPGEHEPPSPPAVRSLDDEDGEDLMRAAGNELKQYWTKGEGLAKWAESPQPWTSLYHHLLKFLGPGRAKRTATEWFHDVFGFYPGSDLNRVTHGKPPRGNKVGPG